MLICRSLWSLHGGYQSLTGDCIAARGVLLERLVKLLHVAFEPTQVVRNSARS